MIHGPRQGSGSLNSPAACIYDRSMVVRLVMVLLLLLSAAVCAQTPYAGAGTLVDRDGESHAWVVSPAASPHQAVVLHLPPRREQQDVGASDGSARLGAALPLVPQALAAWEQRLFMAFAPEQIGGGRTQRPVLIAGTVRGPIGGQWGPEFEGRRLPAAPSLPGEGQLIGMIGTRRGPAALLNRGSTEAPDHQLLILSGSSWREAVLPDQLLEHIRAGPGGHLSLVPRADGLGIVVFMPRDGAAVVWDAGIGADLVLEWSHRRLSLLTADGTAAPPPVGQVHWSGGQFVYAAPARTGAGLELWSFSPEEPASPGAGAWRLAHLPDVTGEWAAAPLDQVGRIAVVWADRVPARSGRGLRIPDAQGNEAQSDGTSPVATAEVRRYIAEVSILTGSVLYHGPVRMRGPVSTEELRLLALMLVALMVVVIVFVLRPEPKGPPLALPPGYALAEPGRRLSASAIDLLLATFLAGQITGVSLWELLTLRGIIAPGGGGLTAIVVLVGIGFVITTLGEWLAGRSPGKLIMGCEVVRPIIERTAEGQIVPSVQPAGLWRSATRNIVKWLLPPIAMAGLGTMEKRHRGDLAADTVVVIRIDEPEPA
jgi:uncharacterized RDD family membrane protein YckC